MLPPSPKLVRRSLRKAALFGAALLLLPSGTATAHNLPLASVWSGIGASPLMSIAIPTEALPEVEAATEGAAQPMLEFDAIAPLLNVEPLPLDWHAPSEYPLLEERSGGLGMEWTVSRSWSVGLTYRRGFENVQLDPTAEVPRGTLGGVAVDDRLATQSLLVEFRLNF